MTASRITDRTKLEELGALVSEALRADGVDVVLTGGAVVSIYTDNEISSFDLDFIVRGISRKVDPTMKRLGFERAGRSFVHPNTKFFVEFPTGPLSVGEEPITETVTRTNAFGSLKMLPPTECVMDRLAAFFFWSDEECLRQAVSVARKHRIDLKRIRKWAQKEGHLQSFEVFRGRIRA